MFIQTEATPNPATLKFIPGVPVSPHETLEFASNEAAQAFALPAALFQISGVARVLCAADYLSVTLAGAEWQHTKPAILGAIMEQMTAGALPMASAEIPAEVEDFDSADAEIVGVIKELLETRIKPAVAGDGGDIVFKGFRGGVVSLSMRGACSGCPSSSATLKHGVENLLRHYVPEVSSVEQV